MEDKNLIDVKGDEAVTTSLLVADFFHKRHTNVMRTIENILTNNTELKNELSEMFMKSSYLDATGRKLPMYYMNRDGFAFLVMGFTGSDATKWKLKFIEAFNQMEEYINFRKADLLIQNNSMKFLAENLEMPCPKDFMKANTIANKCVSNMNGYPKMLKKGDMTQQMLEQREPVLRDVVELMAVNDKYSLNIPISESIYKKYEVKDAKS